jgi:hypothetical protein
MKITTSAAALGLMAGVAGLREAPKNKELTKVERKNAP